MNTNAIQLDSSYFEMMKTYMMCNKDTYRNDLELQIIGALIRNPELIGYVFSKITDEQVKEENKTAFRILSSYNHSLTDMETLELKIKLAKAGYTPENCCIDFDPCESNILGKLQQLIQIRFSIELEKFFIEELKEIENSIDGMSSLFDLRKKIDSLAKEIPNFTNEKTVHETVPEFFNLLESMAARKQELLKSSKFPSFNEITKGIDKENLITILGNTGHGKTFFAAELLIDIAFNNKIPVGIISLEMSQMEVMSRIVGSRVGISSDVLRDGESLRKLTQDQISNLMKASILFKNTNIYISDVPMNEFQLREKVKNWVDVYGVKCVMIDYIGLLGCTQKYKSREEIVSYLSAFIKNLCKEFHIPFILLGQTNRAGLRDPGSTNVAESFKIIANSDFVFTIYQPIKIDPDRTSIIIQGRDIKVTDSLFVVKTDKTRFSGNYKSFFITLQDGAMNELEIMLDDEW